MKCRKDHHETQKIFGKAVFAACVWIEGKIECSCLSEKVKTKQSVFLRQRKVLVDNWRVHATEATLIDEKLSSGHVGCSEAQIQGTCVVKSHSKNLANSQRFIF